MQVNFNSSATLGPATGTSGNSDMLKATLQLAVLHPLNISIKIDRLSIFNNVYNLLLSFYGLPLGAAFNVQQLIFLLKNEGFVFFSQNIIALPQKDDKRNQATKYNATRFCNK